MAGASSGLGVTFAQTLAANGANVVLAARRRDRLDASQRMTTGVPMSTWLKTASASWMYIRMQPCEAALPIE